MSQGELRGGATPYNGRGDPSIRWQAHKRDNPAVPSPAAETERRISGDPRQHRVRSRGPVGCWCRPSAAKFDPVAGPTDDGSRWGAQLRAAPGCENRREDLPPSAMLPPEGPELSPVASVLLPHRQIPSGTGLTLNAPTYTEAKKKISNAGFLQNIFFGWDICSRHSRFRTRVPNRRRLFLECSRGHRCPSRGGGVSRDQPVALSRDWLGSVPREKRARGDRRRGEVLWGSPAGGVH